MESGDYVEIRAALAEGERVVTSGQFLIDSEASLKASLQRMGSEQDADATRTGVLKGTGVLRALRPEDGTVNLEHAPIPALGWPGMTMDFQLAPAASLEGLGVGDEVEFELSGADDGHRILYLRRRGGDGP